MTRQLPSLIAFKKIRSMLFNSMPSLICSIYNRNTCSCTVLGLKQACFDIDEGARRDYCLPKDSSTYRCSWVVKVYCALLMMHESPCESRSDMPSNEATCHGAYSRLLNGNNTRLWSGD